jgi:hypothetical protein
VETDHSSLIDLLRETVDYSPANALAADLLELHDRTSLSLDEWESAKEFIRERVRVCLNAKDVSSSEIERVLAGVPVPNEV